MPSPQKPKKKHRAKEEDPVLYKLSVLPEKTGADFESEYNTLSKSVEAVNNFYWLYKTWRLGAKGGPATHAQQDLYRAMLVFACAGLDVLVKQLVKSRLPTLITQDAEAKIKFRDFVKSGLKDNVPELLKTVALALIEKTPRDVFIDEYLRDLTSDSLQSLEQLRKVADATGLASHSIFTKERASNLKEAFRVRNEIIHEMDINTSPTKGTGDRTRNQRKAPEIEKHAKTILSLAEKLFSSFKTKLQLT